MTQLKQIYKCNVCGNMVEVINTGVGTLVCCGQNMELLEAKGAKEEGQEKHVPVIEKTATGFQVKIGSIPHPMEAKHYIQFIEIIADGQIYRQELQPGQAPEAEFCLEAEKVVAKEYCNIHGLWQS